MRNRKIDFEIAQLEIEFDRADPKEWQNIWDKIMALIAKKYEEETK